MRFGSVCSGIEAASVSWSSLGWKAQFLSEVAPFPSAVLAHHYPTVPNLGDMRNYLEWNDYAIDVLVGGPPCQSYSRAGEGLGLDDPRGDLALTFVAMARRFRPRWIVFENVAGLLSSNDGFDFGTIIGSMGECGYGYAWRVLDAQYFGVPQRRRRVFIVGHYGNWRPSAAVLFERESMRGDCPPIESESGLGPGFAPGSLNGRWWNGDRVSQTLDAVLAKRQTMPEKNRFAALVDEGRLRFVTPLESERLQGFPDEYTAITYKGRPAPDTRRLEAIGNSMPVPVMRWIGERISLVDAIMKKESAEYA